MSINFVNAKFLNTKILWLSIEISGRLSQKLQYILFSRSDGIIIIGRHCDDDAGGRSNLKLYSMILPFGLNIFKQINPVWVCGFNQFNFHFPGTRLYLFFSHNSLFN